MPTRSKAKPTRPKPKARATPRPTAQAAPPAPVRQVPQPPARLTPQQIEFGLIWLANGHNATAAYKAAYGVTNDASARTAGWRLLTNVDIRAWLLAQVEDRWASMQMSADEAQARLAADARADLRLLFDERGKLLPPQQWPDDLANSVEALELDGDKVGKVRLVSKLQARRTILEVHGKLKNPDAGDGFRDLAEILAEKWKG